MRQKQLLTAVLVLISSFAFSQVHPTLQRGFSPEASYEVGEVDAINFFNGNLTVTLPIGHRYPVGGQLSYGLTLVYNSVVWDYSVQPNDDAPTCDGEEDECVAVEARIADSSNAGLGWRLSMGELRDQGIWPNTGGVRKWIYEAPDGSRHLLYPTLHEHETPEDNVWYSRDNSYLRMTATAFDTEQEPVEAVVEGPEGNVKTFAAGYYSGHMSPTRIEDRFGNTLEITYPMDGQGKIDQWVLTDSLNRVQRIFWTTVAERRVVDRVELKAFGTSAAAVYQFVYGSAPTGTVIKETCKDKIFPFESIPVPLLTEVQRPDGTTYKMTDGAGLPAYYTANIGNPAICEVGYSGILKRLVLPTGGVYEWDFGRFEYPGGSGVSGCNVGGNEALQTSLTNSAGVVERRIISAPGQTATWTYERDPVTDPTVATVMTTVNTPDGNERDHYFRTQACRYDEAGPGITAWSGWDYGLPFTRDFNDGAGRFRSVAFYEGSGASRTLLRTQNVAYQHDQLPPIPSVFGWYDTNRRVRARSTVFVDDGNRMAIISSSNFDGLGHYKTTTRSGFGAGTRTETTNFNPGGGSYSIGSNNNYTGNFSLPDTGDPWIINDYGNITQVEDGVTARRENCFNEQTGQPTRTRILKNGTTRFATDVFKVFGYDASGNLTSERTYGGDLQGGLGTSTQTAICGLVLNGQPEYRVLHTYQYGAVKTSRYDGEAFFTVDRTIDANTGLARASRDAAGFETEFTYDAMGRVTEVAPDQGARVDVDYTPAVGDASLPGFGPAEIDVEYRAANNGLLAAEVFEVDGLGRVTAKKRQMPGATWSVQLTDYTLMGWPDRVSEFEAEGTLSPDWTTFSLYDPFGRARLVTRPDGSTTSFDFDGERVAVRTVSIGTTTSGQTQFTTMTSADHLGRVRQVQEPLSVTTNYDYDIGGRLEWVEVVTTGGTQSRAYAHDNRGFLTSETLPEKGSQGNGAVSYSLYDSLGNVGRVVDGPSDLEFDYDRAGRIQSVEAAASCGPFPLKSFSYGQANDGTNRVLGKLEAVSAVNYATDLESICSGSSKLLGDLIFADGFESGGTTRWGTTPTGPEDLTVTQTYAYRGLGGRVSKLTTDIGDDVFTQNFGWSDLGRIQSVVYPDLAGFVEPAAAITTLTYSYARGFLTGVPGYASNISYHPNGALNIIQRTNGGSDVYFADPDSIPRPRWIRAKKGGQTLWYSGLYEYDGAGNITDIGSDTYVYDGLNRLLQGTAVQGAKTQSYTFDGFGNMSSITDSQGTRTITVNTATNRLASPATFDAAGNLMSWGGFSHEWTPTGEMRSRTGSGLSRWFGYTADGERLVSRDLLSGTTTYSLRDLSGKVLRVFEKTGTAWAWKKDYVYRDGMLLAAKEPSETRFFTLDHLGTPRCVTDESGDEVIEHAYFAFGEKADGLWDDESMQFTGHERDLEGTPDAIDDLDYMHARYYRPNLGRFLSVDPVRGTVGSSQSWNRYGYVLNNPLIFADPFGLAECKKTGDEEVECREEITVTADAPGAPTLSFKPKGGDGWAPGTDINDRLRAQPWAGGGQGVLKAGFVDPFEPCAESYRERYDQSLADTKEGFGLGFDLLDAAEFGARATGGAWVAKGVGTDTALSYTLKNLPSLFRNVSVKAAGGALASSTLGGLMVEPSFWIGVKAGSFINVQVVQPIFDPCRK